MSTVDKHIEMLDTSGNAVFRLEYNLSKNNYLTSVLVNPDSGEEIKYNVKCHLQSSLAHISVGFNNSVDWDNNYVTIRSSVGKINHFLNNSGF